MRTDICMSYIVGAFLESDENLLTGSEPGCRRVVWGYTCNVYVHAACGKREANSASIDPMIMWRCLRGAHWFCVGEAGHVRHLIFFRREGRWHDSSVYCCVHCWFPRFKLAPERERKRGKTQPNKLWTKKKPRPMSVLQSLG